MSSRRRPEPISHYLDDGSLDSSVGLDTGLKFVKEYFPKARNELLMATAYFSVKAYHMTRRFIRKKTLISVLIGPHDPDSKRLQQAVVDEIRQELSGVESAQLYEAVVDIHKRIQSGLFRIADARRMERRFHCKLYIIHSRLLWHGSANFSPNGLKSQFEQAAIINKPKTVKDWTAWFKREAATAIDLNAEILKVLEDYLGMANPFDVYLKALFLLLKGKDIQRQLNAYAPVYYQQRLATCAVHQITQLRGSLLVIATGLGKTIVGAEVAGILHAEKEIQHVVLLAPNAVHSAWKDQLEGRGVSCRMYDYKLLFKPTRKQKRYKIAQLLKQLEQANDKVLLIIDESHVYRNQLSQSAGRKGRLPLKRVSAATKKGMRVLLLTGSAYCTNRQNLNSLLSLLPHRNPSSLLEMSPWQTESHTAFGKMPPVVVFSYPHVIEIARSRGDVDAGYPYVEYKGKTRYIPTTIETKFVSFDVLEESAMADAFESGCFNQEKRSPFVAYDDDEGEFEGATDSIFNSTLTALLSSPLTLLRCIEDNLKTPGVPIEPTLFEELKVDNQTGEKTVVYEQGDMFNPTKSKFYEKEAQSAGKAYKTVLKRDPITRLNSLDKIRKRLKASQAKPDDKAQKLISILRSQKQKGSLKAIVFVERHITARYLARVLRNRLRSCSVVCTISENEKLKSAAVRSQILEDFSPLSHDLPSDEARNNILVCTDADGIGVNLQDANIVVNYDLLPGADVLVQRLGRVLRATPKRGRAIYVFTFIPACLDELQKTGVLYKCMRDRYARIFARHNKSSEILESPILPIGTRSKTILLDEKIDIDKGMADYETLVAHDRKDSFAAYISDLEAHRQEAKALPEMLHSAREYEGSTPQMVVVLRHGRNYHALVSDPDSGQITSEDPLDAIRLLACPPDAPRADAFSIDVPGILESAGRTIVQWSDRKGIKAEAIERLLALHLLPVSQKSA